MFLSEFLLWPTLLPTLALDLPPDIASGLAYKWEFGNREWDPSPWMGLDLRGLRARAQIGGSCMCTMGTMGIV